MSMKRVWIAAATAVLVLGLYWLGAGGWSFWGFILLLE